MSGRPGGGPKGPPLWVLTLNPPRSGEWTRWTDRDEMAVRVCAEVIAAARSASRPRPVWPGRHARHRMYIANEGDGFAGFFVEHDPSRYTAMCLTYWSGAGARRALDIALALRGYLAAQSHLVEKGAVDPGADRKIEIDAGRSPGMIVWRDRPAGFSPPGWLTFRERCFARAFVEGAADH